MNGTQLLAPQVDQRVCREALKPRAVHRLQEILEHLFLIVLFKESQHIIQYPFYFFVKQSSLTL